MNSQSVLTMLWRFISKEKREKREKTIGFEDYYLLVQ